ncbi:amylo-alpha-1,6-glucosidase [Labedella populi]|uniref:Amylo-alpha-1,6-glucosidase n=1 Tax=Labedella populi TaxID=2498850 RepID=A0A444QFU4_9MICO|nr:glycogen debranching N-terminal domain-containing protein [Labedella populi]RWZ68390.1 amylo-alpha-1,6-glucosidase [Labedella populi]
MTSTNPTSETTRPGDDEPAVRPLQPLLHDSVVVLRAPTQAWSAEDGDIGATVIHGIYHGDTRVAAGLRVRVGDTDPEAVSVAPRGATGATFVSLVREIDGHGGADPRVRLERRRDVSAGSVVERLTLSSGVDHTIETSLVVELSPDFSTMSSLKAGIVDGAEWSGEPIEDGIVISSGSVTLRVTAPGAVVSTADGKVRVSWPLDVPPHASESRELCVAITDESLVVVAPRGEVSWRAPEGTTSDPRVARWVAAALADLDALRLALPDHPDDEFLAAGAPWFFTLFGRDSIWAARLLLPVTTDIAASTLRILARLQGIAHDPESAEQPGKIMHELRSAPLTIPGEGVTLPPVYYGTVDATALWVTLLADAYAAGMSELAVTELLPTLRGCLDWIIQPGDNDGDGFLDYVDLTGHGLANQGWKDSGDSIQWRDGRLAEGPIALCEVQGYAYEAVMAGARLLEALGDGRDDTQALRSWAADLKRRFAEAYWVETPEGRYPAVALDAHKRPVDSLTSNIGHLLGTGILDAEEEGTVATLLIGPSMSSGFGLRTLSTEAAGYWPLSYHGGSVWTHDTAIAIAGLVRSGHLEQARVLSEGLLTAAERFSFRMPELYSGDAADEFSSPTPYPAACRPQAWSAAAAFAVQTAVTS